MQKISINAYNASIQYEHLLFLGSAMYQTLEDVNKALELTKQCLPIEASEATINSAYNNADSEKITPIAFQLFHNQFMSFKALEEAELTLESYEACIEKNGLNLDSYITLQPFVIIDDKKIALNNEYECYEQGCSIIPDMYYAILNDDGTVTY